MISHAMVELKNGYTGTNIVEIQNTTQSCLIFKVVHPKNI